MNFFYDWLGWLLRHISILFDGNFAWAVFVFTVIINVVLIPLSIKSQKATVQQQRIKPKLDALKKKYGNDQKRYNEEMQKLYAEEKVSMSGGCLPMIIRLLLMLAVYGVILSPLTYMVGINKTDIGKTKEIVEEYDVKVKNRNWEIEAANLIVTGENAKGRKLDAADMKKVTKYITKEDVNKVDFDFFGISLMDTPKFSWNIFGDFKKNWLIPILAFAAQILSSVLSMRIQKQNNPDAPSMALMMFGMPVISLFIAFTLPCAVGFYWACSSLIAGVIQAGVQKYYGPNVMIAKDQIKESYERFQKERKKLSSTEE